MAYTTINKGTDHFQAEIWSSQDTSIDTINFTPDWVWIKSRTNADTQVMFDTVRGATKRLSSSGTTEEQTKTDELSAFNSDGYTLGTGDNVNRASNDYVSWNWKAGGAASSNTDGTNITSSVSVNSTAGFSIVSYTGSGTISDTVGHGLGSTPKWIILKNRDSGSAGWNVHHANLSSGYNLQLQATATEFNSTGQGHIGTVTSSTFGFVAGTSGNDQVNDSGDKYIAYCFIEKKGFSKFGEYSGGNANADGPFVYLGFKPAFVLVRDGDNAENWLMYDNKRPGFNLTNDHLFANTNDVETSSTANTMDFVSNGFKIRSTNNGLNRSGGNFLFMAFAEHPFVSSTGTPCTAR